MNIFDKFLNSISYKFPKGYPDMSSPNDISLLESLIGEVLGEAFSVFPKSEDEIDNPKIKQLFRIVKSYPGLSLEDPIVLDPNKSSSVKISRSLQRDSKFIAFLSEKLGVELDPYKGGKWNGLSINWGEGSRGGRGIKSKGIGFEGELASDLELLRDQGINENNKDQFIHPDLVIKIAKELDLKQGNFDVRPEGDKNQSRPLTFDGGPTISFSGESAASTLTDITIIKDSKEYYLSAKFGSTTTFFNSGITKVLPENEIKSGEIKNSNGKALLDTLGIDNETFCKVFNDYPNGDFSSLNGATSKYDSSKLSNLIKSGIGEGYYMVTAGKGGYEFYKIDSEYLNKASTVTSGVEVYYGGLEGKGKRVDVIFESELYKFKVNIRSKTGSVYPTHIMCDYYKK